MELLITSLITFLILPYLFYVWLFGIVLSKKLYEKEIKAVKGLLREFQKLSSEQRMEIDLKRDKEEPKKSTWLDSPSPRLENEKRKEELKEPILEISSKGKWEDQKDQEIKPSIPAIIG